MKIRPWFTLAGAALLTACASGPQTPPNFYQLRLEAPQAQAQLQARPDAAPTGHWQLLGPVRLPEYLQRDVLWLPVGSSGLQPMEGQRWAEPLRDALPRILLHDLGQLRGSDRVWAGSLPPGLVIGRQLRLEVLAFESSADRRSVQLRVRWWAGEPLSKTAPQAGELSLSAPSAGPAADQLVAAHRLVLWMLAERLVETIDLAPPARP